MNDYQAAIWLATSILVAASIMTAGGVWSIAFTVARIDARLSRALKDTAHD